MSGDKGFYPARITSVTGSSAARVYTVKFKSYDTVETLRARDIRSVGQKRKADGTPASSAGPSSTASPAPGAAASGPVAAGSSAGNGVVMTAAASLYPQAQQQREEEEAAAAAAAAGGEAAPKKFKKIKAKKELEAGKSKWQEFSNKSKFAKNNKNKDSMFRTPEGIHGRGMLPPSFLPLFYIAEERV